jgi:hypothetical protein
MKKALRQIAEAVLPRIVFMDIMAKACLASDERARIEVVTAPGPERDFRRRRSERRSLVCCRRQSIRTGQKTRGSSPKDPPLERCGSRRSSFRPPRER